MPYLRVYSPELTIEQKRELARELTDGIMRALDLPEAERGLCTVHFTPFTLEDFAIGGTLMVDSRDPDFLLELHHHDLGREQKEALARELTAVAAHLLGGHPERADKISVLFREYNRSDMAVGGRFLDGVADHV